jgi:uncharacterized membrane protein required for colicin V production
MDIVGAIRSAPFVDLAIFAGLFGSFILGVMQGSIRRILGIISIVFAFLMAANLRGPVGDYLAQNWHQFNGNYNRLLAFVILFIVLAVGFSVLIQGFYKRTDIYAAHPVVDDVVGGLLGLLQGFVILVVAVIILGSYDLPNPAPGDVSQLRWVQDLLMHQSHIAAGIHDMLVPPLIHVLAGLLPSDLVSVYP